MNPAELKFLMDPKANGKACTKCGIHQTPDKYSAHVSTRDGLQSQCRTCVNEANKAAYAQKASARKANKNPNKSPRYQMSFDFEKAAA